MIPKMKLILILISVVTLSGCGTLSLFSGNSSETLAKNPNCDPTSFFCRPVKLRTKQTQAAAIGDNAEKAIVAIAASDVAKYEVELEKVKKQAPAMSCYSLSFDQINSLKAAAQALYFDTADRCMERLQYANVIQNQNKIISMLLNPTSDVAAVAKEFGVTMRSVAHEGTAKLQAIASFGKVSFVATEARKTIQSSNEALGSGIKYASENSGDTTVGDIVLGSSSQHGSADGNSGGSSSGLFGDSDGGDESSGDGGDGSGSSTNASSDENPITIVIGDSNAISSDDGRSFADTSNTQQLDTSATGAITTQSKIYNQQVADDLHDAPDELNVDDKDTLLDF